MPTSYGNYNRPSHDKVKAALGVEIGPTVNLEERFNVMSNALGAFQKKFDDFKMDANAKDSAFKVMLEDSKKLNDSLKLNNENFEQTNRKIEVTNSRLEKTFSIISGGLGALTGSIKMVASLMTLVSSYDKAAGASVSRVLGADSEGKRLLEALPRLTTKYANDPTSAARGWQVEEFTQLRENYSRWATGHLAKTGVESDHNVDKFVNPTALMEKAGMGSLASVSTQLMQMNQVLDAPIDKLDKFSRNIANVFKHSAMSAEQFAAMQQTVLALGVAYGKTGDEAFTFSTKMQAVAAALSVKGLDPNKMMGVLMAGATGDEEGFKRDLILGTAGTENPQAKEAAMRGMVTSLIGTMDANSGGNKEVANVLLNKTLKGMGLGLNAVEARQLAETGKAPDKRQDTAKYIEDMYKAMDETFVKGRKGDFYQTMGEQFSGAINGLRGALANFGTKAFQSIKTFLDSSSFVKAMDGLANFFDKHKNMSLSEMVFNAAALLGLKSIFLTALKEAFKMLLTSAGRQALITFVPGAAAAVGAGYAGGEIVSTLGQAWLQLYYEKYSKENMQSRLANAKVMREQAKKDFASGKDEQGRALRFMASQLESGTSEDFRAGKDVALHPLAAHSRVLGMVGDYFRKDDQAKVKGYMSKEHKKLFDGEDAKVENSPQEKANFNSELFNGLIAASKAIAPGESSSSTKQAFSFDKGALDSLLQKKGGITDKDSIYSLAAIAAGRGFTVTSGAEKETKHGDKSVHYDKGALDFSIKDLSKEKADAFASELEHLGLFVQLEGSKEALAGYKFRTKVENDKALHMHAQLPRESSGKKTEVIARLNEYLSSAGVAQIEESSSPSYTSNPFADQSPVSRGRQVGGPSGATASLVSNVYDEQLNAKVQTILNLMQNREGKKSQQPTAPPRHEEVPVNGKASPGVGMSHPMRPRYGN